MIADGFYEWKKITLKEKQPYAIAMADDSQMVMAGLWSTWKNPVTGEEITSCTMLTCTPNEVMAELHDRSLLFWAKRIGPSGSGKSRRRISSCSIC